MNPVPLIAIAIGLVAILGGNAIEGGTLGSLVQPTAALIVIGGTLSATWLGSTSAELKALRRLLPRVLKNDGVDRRKLVDKMLDIAGAARKEGLLALESKLPEIDNPFLRRGVRLLVDGTEADAVVSMLELEMEVYEHQHAPAGKVFESAGGFSPTIGILGAVLGLIHVMHNLTDPSKLGEGIAVAFVATIYGVGFANMLFIPLGNRIRKIVGEDLEVNGMILQGIEIIGVGANPRHLEEVLQPYVVHEAGGSSEAA